MPGHTQKRRPASANGRTTPAKPRSTSSLMPKRAAISRTRVRQRGRIDRRLVVPGQGDEPVARQLGHQIRVLAHDVAPEEHLAALGAQRAEQALEVLQVDAAAAARVDVLTAASAPELEGLVAADVHLPALQVLHQLAHETQRELCVFRRRREHGGRPAAEARQLVAVRRLGPRAIGRMAQPALHVAEAVLVRDQLDAVRLAQRVEPAQVVRRERRRVAPDDLVAAIGEGVLDVELEVVEAQPRQQRDEALERRARRHAIAAHVEHQAAHGQRRRSRAARAPAASRPTARGSARASPRRSGARSRRAPRARCVRRRSRGRSLRGEARRRCTRRRARPPARRPHPIRGACADAGRVAAASRGSLHSPRPCPPSSTLIITSSTPRASTTRSCASCPSSRGASTRATSRRWCARPAWRTRSRCRRRTARPRRSSCWSRRRSAEFVAGVVGWVPLADPPAAARALDALRRSSGPPGRHPPPDPRRGRSRLGGAAARAGVAGAAGRARAQLRSVRVLAPPPRARRHVREAGARAARRRLPLRHAPRRSAAMGAVGERVRARGARIRTPG